MEIAVEIAELQVENEAEEGSNSGMSLLLLLLLLLLLESTTRVAPASLNNAALLMDSLLWHRPSMSRKSCSLFVDIDSLPSSREVVSSSSIPLTFIGKVFGSAPHS